MGISVPSSWITGMQGLLTLLLAASFAFDQPLGIIAALGLSALLMTQDEEGAPPEYRPVTTLLVIAGLLFLADYPAWGWGISLACGAFSLLVLFGLRPYQTLAAGFQDRKTFRPQQPVRRRR